MMNETRGMRPIRSRLEVIRTLCYNSEFGPTLYDMLTPVEIASFVCATFISLTTVQVHKYMQIWRLFFTSRK